MFLSYRSEIGRPTELLKDSAIQHLEQHNERTKTLTKHTEMRKAFCGKQNHNRLRWWWILDFLILVSNETRLHQPKTNDM